MDGIITDSASVTTALDGINKAYEEQNTDVTSLVDTLGKYTSEQLEGIDFNDGKWDTELGDAEKAVESLCEKLGLTKDQARSVIEALKEAGKLKDSEKSSDSSKETTTLSTQLTDLTTLMQNFITNQDECTVASFRSSLWRMHRDFMAQGYITPDGLKTFLEMGKLYEKAGGNDIYHEKLLPDIESLEVRYTKDNVL